MTSVDPATLATAPMHISRLVDPRAKFPTSLNAPTTAVCMYMSAWDKIPLTHSPVVTSFAKKKKNIVLTHSGVRRVHSIVATFSGLARWL